MEPEAEYARITRVLQRNDEEKADLLMTALKSIAALPGVPENVRDIAVLTVQRIEPNWGPRILKKALPPFAV